MHAIDLLVKADYLYPMTDGLPVIGGAEIAVAGDRILYAGLARPSGHWKAGRVIARPGSVVLPGFVNCHCHTASVVFRSQTDDFSRGVGLAGIAFRMEKDISEDEWRLLGQIGCADMLRAGVTTINDIWYSPSSLAETVEALRPSREHRQQGVRCSPGGTVSRRLHRYPTQGDSRLRDGITFVERWHGACNGRITGRIGTHATDTCSADLHRQARAEANRLGVGMHIHAAQSAAEVRQIQAEHGCGPMEYLRDIGMLAPDVVLAHLSFATDADLDAVQEAKARYAHCPTIYPRRGQYPRLDAILARDIPTGFGTDWMQNDPFEGMRNAMNVMRVRHQDADLLPGSQVLWFHTMGAARVLGMEAEIGSLEPGKKADMIVVDVNRTHLQPVLRRVSCAGVLCPRVGCHDQHHRRPCGAGRRPSGLSGYRRGVAFTAGQAAGLAQQTGRSGKSQRVWRGLRLRLMAELTVPALISAVHPASAFQPHPLDIGLLDRSLKEMEIHPTPDQEAFIRLAIETGRLRSPEDAVTEALGLWEERERRRLDVLVAIDEAEASLARGEGRPITPANMRELASAVKRRGRIRLGAEHKADR